MNNTIAITLSILIDTLKQNHDLQQQLTNLGG